MEVGGLYTGCYFDVNAATGEVYYNEPNKA